MDQPAWAETLPTIKKLKSSSENYSDYLTSIEEFLLDTDKEKKILKEILKIKQIVQSLMLK